MKFDIEEIKQYIENNPNSKIIIGGDSQKMSSKKRKKLKIKQKTARFVTCVIVYKKDKNKIFYEVSKESDFDHNPAKPMLRMMQEVQKITSIAVELLDVISNKDFEIHLDINKSSEHGSNCALGQAIGYVWGMLGVEPIVKPNSWAASCVADHIVKTNKNVLNYTF